MEEIDYHLLVRRAAMVARLAANGDEEALAWRNKFFGNLKESSDESDEQDDP